MATKNQRAQFDLVVDRLGGATAVAKLTKRSVASVCNWRTRGFFPARLADGIREALAPPEVFRMEKFNDDAA